MAEVELLNLRSSVIYSCEIDASPTTPHIFYVKMLDQTLTNLGEITLKINFLNKTRQAVTPESKFRNSENDKSCISTSREFGQQKTNFLLRKYETLIDQLKIKNELLASVKDDLFKQKNSLEAILNEERDYVTSLENKIKQVSQDYSEALKRSEDRDGSFLQKLNTLVKENSELQKENYQLSCEVKTLESENFYMQENMKRISFFNFETFLVEYSRKIDEISEMYYKSEKERDALQNMLKGSDEIAEKIIKSTNSSTVHLENQNKTLLKDIKDLQDELKFYKLQQTEVKIEEANLREIICIKDQKLQEIKKTLEDSKYEVDQFKNKNEELKNQLKIAQDENDKLEHEMSEYKCKVMQSVKLERTRLDDIDLMLEKYFADQNLENLFVKISTGLYVYGTKKINVSIRNGLLICRVGGGYLVLEEFLRQEQGEKQVQRKTTTNSPLNSIRNTFNFPVKHGKTNSLVSHLVSPKQRGRLTMSFDMENTAVDKIIDEKPKLDLKRLST
ncbi:hypothetical protein SteCoe_15849 [Stentor coeruleus]|uniref:GAR domain-containing protein n=1 Tax=Stentor coeruleus TaxID=5963 RepID=A0A1R2C2Q2_9CILI|nr:hypothetical protein SteCoe_15849 [Stentor coeruleus]